MSADGRPLQPGSIAGRVTRAGYADYPLHAGGLASGDVTVATAFATVCRIGGGEGWFYADSLWYVRRAIDWIVGGPSFRRLRRHPTDLRLGDVVDSWRVIGLEPDRRLTLAMEMKGPGTGVLEFIVRPDADGGTSVSATAYWDPAGIAGRLYWLVLIPAHLFIFRGLTRSIIRRSGAQPR
jgi:hypothetical protein